MQYSQDLQLKIDNHMLLSKVPGPDPRNPPYVAPMNVQLHGRNTQLMTAWPSIPEAQYMNSQKGDRNPEVQTYYGLNHWPVI